MAGILDSRYYLPTLAVIVAGVLGYAWWSGEQERKESIRAQQVSVLPDGVRAQWESYVDKRLAATIIPDGSQLRVAQFLDDIIGGTTIVSRNSPYTVMCDDFSGAAVSFGSGDDAVTVHVFGALVLEDDEPEPELGVDAFSVAALELYASLCPRVATYMKTVTTTP